MGSPQEAAHQSRLEFLSNTVPGHAIEHLGIFYPLLIYFVVAGTTLAQGYFLIERYRPLADAPALANR